MDGPLLIREVLPLSFLWLQVAIAALAAGTMLIYVTHGVRTRRDPLESTVPLSLQSTQTSFLLDGERIVDATEEARLMLARNRIPQSGRAELAALLTRSFGDLESVWPRDDGPANGALLSPDGTRCLSLRREGQMIRVTISDCELLARPGERDPCQHSAETEELDHLRLVTDRIPFPVWRQRPDGVITWCNKAYLDLASQGSDAPVGTWPPPMVLSVDAQTRWPEHEDGRLRLQSSCKPDQWYDCHLSRIGEDMLISASDASGIVEAETSRSDVVQTLSKTFATLTIGLAVFSPDRRLALFNPALTDLTTLPVTLLLERPDFFSFIDALRSRKKMPEPKDYKTWRAQIARFDSSDAGAPYSEAWHLPFGQTLKITGQPQPNGALALLFEDITAEISMTRNLRAELETAQTVFNALDDALAVFDAGGTLTMSNDAYDILWKVETRHGVLAQTIGNAAERWRNLSVPCETLNALQAYLAESGKTDGWEGELRLRDGRSLICRLAPMPGGALRAMFTPMIQHPAPRLTPVHDTAEEELRVEG
ncbi:PAS-domain containing protein [Profundibacterium mesophilum]|uniref:PAS domain containing protein n=1 Tax=Profundibacterium mesophilum KAUST100406-0324 TaxID=1037889 RepID=A0A921NVX1_9RHOB|nr:PAS-domain containing protein [Profundibacterium mesophilum]KAF0676301.1 PAS domain containing protein [Profundibacterium mesophilum KAUST100406-0324]